MGVNEFGWGKTEEKGRQIMWGGLDDPDMRNAKMCDGEASRVLTDRQVEIIGHVAKGLNFREIGEELDISGRTVQKHIEEICKKMGARNKTHMVAMALAQNIIEPPPVARMVTAAFNPGLKAA